MKPPLFLLIFVSSFAALLALPFSPDLAVSPIVLSGLALIMRADYGRRLRPLTVPVRARAANQAPEWFRLAA